VKNAQSPEEQVANKLNHLQHGHIKLPTPHSLRGFFFVFFFFPLWTGRLEPLQSADVHNLGTSQSSPSLILEQYSIFGFFFLPPLISFFSPSPRSPTIFTPPLLSDAHGFRSGQEWHIFQQSYWRRHPASGQGALGFKSDASISKWNLCLGLQDVVGGASTPALRRELKRREKLKGKG
jgi:hypothetical protein